MHFRGRTCVVPDGGILLERRGEQVTVRADSEGEEEAQSDRDATLRLKRWKAVEIADHAQRLGLEAHPSVATLDPEFQI